MSRKFSISINKPKHRSINLEFCVNSKKQFLQKIKETVDTSGADTPSFKITHMGKTIGGYVLSFRVNNPFMVSIVEYGDMRVDAGFLWDELVLKKYKSAYFDEARYMYIFKTIGRCGYQVSSYWTTSSLCFADILESIKSNLGEVRVISVEFVDIKKAKKIDDMIKSARAYS